MARHPGMQNNNRMRELADKITWANLKAMGDLGEVARLEVKLRSARSEAESSEKKARELSAFAAKMIVDVRYGGITDWGLPGTIKMTEWEVMVGKPSDSFYWDQSRDQREGPKKELCEQNGQS